MADFEDNGINLQESPKAIYARQALFKRLTLEELERRYQKHMSRLRPEEDQAVRQVIDKFKKGWYIEIQAHHWMETFYSPVSPLFALFFFLVKWAPWYMPFTYTFSKSLFKKDDPTVCLTFAMLPLFPYVFICELILLIFLVLFMLVLLFLAILAEFLVFVGGMCYYRFGRLQKCGVFVYGCKLKLIVARGHGSQIYGNVISTVTLTKYDDGAKLVLHHASLCRTIFCNPINAIFKNLNSKEYSYGDIQGVQLSTREVEMYILHQQQSAALQSQAISLA